MKNQKNGAFFFLEQFGYRIKQWLETWNGELVLEVSSV
jgi:hypothetical protein